MRLSSNYLVRFCYAFLPVIFVFFHNITHANQKTLVKTERILLKEVFDTYSVIGEVNYQNSKKIHAKVSGNIDFINENNSIKRGEIILAIDQELAKSLIASSESAYKKSQLSFDRATYMHKNKFASDEELERVKSLYTAAKQNLEEAKIKYNNMIIRSDFDCVVGSIPYTVGSSVNIGDFLFSATDQSSMSDINFYVAENVLGKVDTKSELLIKLLDQKILKSNVHSSSNYINDSGNGIVKARVKHDLLKHGSFVDAELRVNKHNAFCVKESAVINSNDGTYIFASENGIAKKIPVEIGSRIDDYVEILSDQLSENTCVIVHGITKVLDGSEVQEIKEGE